MIKIIFTIACLCLGAVLAAHAETLNPPAPLFQAADWLRQMMRF
jgi:hypothetical protein